MTTFRQAISYTNAQNKKVLLLIEPWAEHYWIEPGMTVDVVGEGREADAKFELQHTSEELIVYGWTDSVVIVMHEGSQLDPSPQE